MGNEIKIPRIEPIKRVPDFVSGVTIHAVRMMVANGDVISIRVGRKILVNVDSLIEFLNTGIPQGAALAKAALQTETVPRIAPISLR